MILIPSRRRPSLIPQPLLTSSPVLLRSSLVCSPRPAQSQHPGLRSASAGPGATFTQRDASIRGAYTCSVGSRHAPGQAVAADAVTTSRRLSPWNAAGRLAAMRTAAVKVAEAHGYDAFSMQDVAETAGVSRTTLYKHFPSKDHLLFDALRDIWPQHLANPPKDHQPPGCVAMRWTCSISGSSVRCCSKPWPKRPSTSTSRCGAPGGDEPTYTTLDQLHDFVLSSRSGTPAATLTNPLELFRLAWRGPTRARRASTR